MRRPCRILPATLLMLLVMAAPINALEIRGAVFNVLMPEVVWTPQNFAGFYYDLDHDLGYDSLTLRLSDATPTGATISGEQDETGNYGVVYKTNMRQAALNNAKIGATYGKLIVADINKTTGIMTLDNRGNEFSISRNKTIELMPGIGIKTGYQDGTAYTPLRYYIYKKITDPGTYQLRGTVANVMQNQVTWDNSSFPGFYYDLDRNIGAETLTFRLSNTTTKGATLSDKPDDIGNRGVVYETQAQLKRFKCRFWGQYDVMPFLGEPYFASYDPTVTADVAAVNEDVAFLYDQSRNRNLMTSEQISKVLVDDDTVRLIKKSIKLQEGYELVLKSVNSNGQVYLQLLKNGQLIDETFISPPIYNTGIADMPDKTYCFRKDLGDTSNIILIAVHFRSVYMDTEQPMAIVDGIWQISDTPIQLNIDQQYGKMSIRNVDPTGMTITMDNKNNRINLTRKSDIELMPSIHIRTADNETLRYYIYKTETLT